MKNLSNPQEKYKFIKPFLEFYTGEPINDNELCSPDESNRNDPQSDCFHNKSGTLIEDTQIIEEKKQKILSDRGKNVKRLYEELDLRDLSSITGIYSVDVPLDFRVKRGDEKNVIDQIINTIKNNQSELNIPKLGKLYIEKKSDQGNDITFPLYISGTLNPASTIHQIIKGKILHANDQLGKFEDIRVKKRILLLVDYSLDHRNSAIDALSRSYNQLLKCKNIDEIWLQYEKPKDPVLLYTRDFLVSFDQGCISTDNDTIGLFEKWFYPLTELGDEYKEKALKALKILLENKQPYELFINSDYRELMIYYLGIWLSQNQRFDDVIWIIEKFINDPDPEEPEKQTDSLGYKLHIEIANGEDRMYIRTVLGRLASVVRELANQKEYISKALEYTERLISHRNLYIKFQAITPLVVIAAKRQWLNGYGERPRKEEYKKFHDLTFDLIKLIENNPGYKVIAKWLCYVFMYYSDLSTEESEQILDALRFSDESARLFIYFGIYRQEHYKDHYIEFDAEKLKNKLIEVINDKSDTNQRLRNSIIWHLRKIQREYPDESEKLREFKLSILT